MVVQIFYETFRRDMQNGVLKKCYAFLYANFYMTSKITFELIIIFSVLELCSCRRPFA